MNFFEINVTLWNLMIELFFWPGSAAAVAARPADTLQNSITVCNDRECAGPLDGYPLAAPPPPPVTFGKPFSRMVVL